MHKQTAYLEVSVKDELPKSADRYYVILNGLNNTCYFNGIRFEIEEWNEKKLTHWLKKVEDAVVLQWISVDDYVPDLIVKQDCSKNVFALCDGKVLVMTYCFIKEDDGHYVWCNCYGDINGDGEFDNNYEVTHWMPIELPSPPNS